jgi:hypothetical protein
MPLFAKASEGHIGIQGDHGEISTIQFNFLIRILRYQISPWSP